MTWICEFPFIVSQSILGSMQRNSMWLRQFGRSENVLINAKEIHCIVFQLWFHSNVEILEKLWKANLFYFFSLLVTRPRSCFRVSESSRWWGKAYFDVIFICAKLFFNWAITHTRTLGDLHTHQLCALWQCAWAPKKN